MKFSDELDSLWAIEEVNHTDPKYPTYKDAVYHGGFTHFVSTEKYSLIFAEEEK